MSTLIETEGQIVSILERMYSSSEKIDNPKATLDSMMGLAMETTQRSVDSNNRMNLHWEMFFTRCGAAAIKILGEDLNVAKFVELLLSKHKLYGAGPLVRWGEIGIAIRLDSKVSRADNLTRNMATENNGETIIDTFTDILGYSVLGYRLHQIKRSEA